MAENQAPETGSEGKENTPKKTVRRTTSTKKSTNSLISKTSKTMANSVKTSGNYFKSLIHTSDDAILSKRADLAASSTENMLNMNIMNVESQINDIEMEIAQTEDLGKTNSMSLEVGKDFHAENFIAKIFDLEFKKQELEENLGVLLKMKAKYFGA